MIISYKVKVKTKRGKQYRITYNGGSFSLMVDVTHRMCESPDVTECIVVMTDTQGGEQVARCK